MRLRPVFCFVVCALLLQFASSAFAQLHEDAFGYCARVVTDDDPGRVPASLVPAFVKAFGSLARPALNVEGYLRYRCYQGTVIGCVVGANLNCGKAEVGQTSQGGNNWCQSHPNDPNVPMVATGHATVYIWRCSGSRAVLVRRFSPIDDRGFDVMNWKVLN
jgi:hypothetical protein